LVFDCILPFIEFALMSRQHYATSQVRGQISARKPWRNSLRGRTLYQIWIWVLIAPATVQAERPIRVTDLGPVSADPIMSSDGATLGLNPDSGGPVLWTGANGRQAVGTLDGETGLPAVRALSGNGHVAVGATTINGVSQATMWQNGRPFQLGSLAGPAASASATGVSADGRVVVGYSSTSLFVNGGPFYNHTFAVHPFLWTAQIGMVDLRPSGTEATLATAVSGDGNVVIGTSQTTYSYHIMFNSSSVFRWSAQTGYIELDYASFQETSPSANAVNRDGSVVVGSVPVNRVLDDGYGSHYGWGSVAVYWDTAGKRHALGSLGGVTSSALGVDGDGRIIVGWADNAVGKTVAFRWTPSAGMQDLNRLLAKAHLNMSGIVLTSATAISENGQFIAAQGDSSADSTSHAYLVRYLEGFDIAGISTPELIAASVDQFAMVRGRFMAQQHGLAAAFLGETLPLDVQNEADTFGLIGSAVSGAGSRIGPGDGFSLRVALGYTEQAVSGVKQDGAMMGSLSARYVYDYVDTAQIRWRPLVEMGGWLAPNLALNFSRSYANGNDVAVGDGSTHGTAWYGYARVGGAFSITDRDTWVVSGETGRQRLATGGWQEAVSAANPLNAEVAASTTGQWLGKLRSQWTHVFSDRLEATLTLAGVRVLGTDGTVPVNVADVGVYSPGLRSGTLWMEYGARVGWRIGRATLDAFVGGVTGDADSVGTSIHAGLGARVRF
jgi:probable HAF family extracellular repeat protein